MITTVTTVTTVTSMTLAATTISIAAVFLLLFLLITKELAGSGQSLSARISSPFLNVGILPLAIVFATITVVRVIQVLA